jgi:hypothetical protein
LINETCVAIIFKSTRTKSISNNFSNEVDILINLAKTQKFISNNSSNQLAIYPKLLFTGLARIYLRARKGLAIAVQALANACDARPRDRLRSRSPSRLAHVEPAHAAYSFAASHAEDRCTGAPATDRRTGGGACDGGWPANGRSRAASATLRDGLRAGAEGRGWPERGGPPAMSAGRRCDEKS